MLIFILSACSIPAGKEIRSTTISGIKEPTRIERREIDNKYIAFVTAEGLVYRGIDTSVEYWIKNGGRTNLLPHISTHGTDKKLKEILGVDGTDQWVAFDLNDVTRESGDLTVIVFNEQRVIYTQRISNCRRVDLCAEHYENMASYSIKANKDNSLIHIETLSGKRTYDVIKGKLLES